MDIDTIKYVQSFSEKLGDVVSNALDLGNPILGGLKATSIYSVDLQVAAALAGYRLGIPEELAIAYIVMAEGVSYEKSINRISPLPSEKREIYDMHQKLVEFVTPVLDSMRDDTLASRFFEVLSDEASTLR